MHRIRLLLLAAGAAAAATPALAGQKDPLVIPGVGPEQAPAAVQMNRPTAPRMRTASNSGSGLGGGFIEFLVTGGGSSSRGAVIYNQPQPANAAPVRAASYAPAPLQAQRTVPQEFMRTEVEYPSTEKPGTIVVDTPSKYLYLVQGGGRAIRYGIGVGRPGFTWAGVKTVSRKAEWPAWTPPPEMLLRRPDLPRHMEGGPENPLGARALYLGSSLYRIHGTNEPYTIGQNVSSGCIRMMNEDVTDLYERVRVGTRVVVM
jgi:lipoprotein-anchoring transpeptidase ErfK/SrfK